MLKDENINITSEANFIWSIANKLRGSYKSDKYKDVIIPMVIIRRFECALESSKKAIVELYETNKSTPKEIFLKKVKEKTGHKFDFYNTSRQTLSTLLNSPDYLVENFRDYLNHFSDNIQDIMKKLEFYKQIETLDKAHKLYIIIEAFSDLDLSPERVEPIKMGYIFEELIRKFSENDQAGEHYTGRDLITLMVDILLAEGCEDLKEDGKVITVLDQACGTGGMLSVAYNRIKEINPNADVYLYGQEINPESYAFCLAEMLIKGQSAENIRFENSFICDAFANISMRFVIENPPFGTPWGGKDVDPKEEKAVLDEAMKGFSGRYGAGLPAKSDGQLLFMQSAIKKLDDKRGRCAIIENGSPLFVGDTASGESQIRKWILENDLLEAIIALPTDFFYNTGISTYIWILSKNKSLKRKGKVQLIDASQIYHKLRKALGDKKNEVTAEDREKILGIYSSFKESEVCKIFRNEDFMYKEYTIMQPLQRSFAINEERIEEMIDSGVLKSIFDEAKYLDMKSEESEVEYNIKDIEKQEAGKIIYEYILEVLNNSISDKIYYKRKAFEEVILNLFSKNNKIKIDNKILEKVIIGLSKMDKNAEIEYDNKGNILYDKETKDIEIIKLEEDIEEYMAREVLPHIPDAAYFFEEKLSASKPIIKTGAEIPFTRYFYKFKEPISSEELLKDIISLEENVQNKMKEIFGV